jgi:hypothetical protein
MPQQDLSKREMFPFTALKDLRSSHADIKDLLNTQAEVESQLMATFRAEKANLHAENTMLKQTYKEHFKEHKKAHRYLLDSCNSDRVEWQRRLRALDDKQSSIEEQFVPFTSRFFSFSPTTFGS